MNHANMHTRNYARNVITQEYIFFQGPMPALSCPEYWAFWRLPLGQDADLFRGRIIGENPASAEEPESDPEAPASSAT